MCLRYAPPPAVDPAEQQALGASENWRMQDQENEKSGALTQHTGASMRVSIPPFCFLFMLKKVLRLLQGKVLKFRPGKCLQFVPWKNLKIPPKAA